MHVGFARVIWAEYIAGYFITDRALRTSLVQSTVGAALCVLIVKTSFTFCYQHILYTLLFAAFFV